MPSKLNASEMITASSGDKAAIDALITDLARRKGEAEQAETVLRKVQAATTAAQEKLDASTAAAKEALDRQLAEIEAREKELVLREEQVAEIRKFARDTEAYLDALPPLPVMLEGQAG